MANQIKFSVDPFGGAQPSGSGYYDEKSQLRAKVDAQTKLLLEQQEVLKTLATPPFLRGQILAVSPAQNPGEPNLAFVGVGGQHVEVPVPPGLKVKVSDTVRLNKSMAIVAVMDESEVDPAGVILSAGANLGDKQVEVEAGGLRKVVTTQTPVTKGDRILVDSTLSFVLRNLGKQEQEYQADVERITTTWEDIGGQRQAKVEMQEAIEGPIKHRAIFHAYGKKAVKGILLFGPPGCGKTLLAKAAANSLAKLHGKSSASGFIYVKGPEILSKWVGQSEESVRKLFTRARDHFNREGYPAVLFIDEADAILGARSAQNQIGGMEKTIVPQFLAEMDGLDENGPLVLLATNRSDSLDPAVVRDGRIDRKIEVTRPTQEDAVEIFRMYLRGKPMSAAIRDGFADSFAAATFASPSLRARVCGALICGLVEQAADLAMRRDIAAGTTKPTGLTLDDIAAAVKSVEAQNRKVL